MSLTAPSPIWGISQRFVRQFGNGSIQLVMSQSVIGSGVDKKRRGVS